MIDGGKRRELLRPSSSLMDEDLPREPSSKVGFSPGYLLLHSEARLASSAFAPERLLRARLQNGESNNNE